MTTKPNDLPIEDAMENTNFQLEINRKLRLEVIAEKTERSLSGLLRLIVKEYLEEH